MLYIGRKSAWSSPLCETPNLASAVSVAKFGCPHLINHHPSCRMILSSRNDDVNNLNSLMLNSFPGQEQTFFSEDSVTNDRPDEGELMYPADSINCSGLPLAKLHLNIGCPVMVLRNLFPAEGVCNGTRGIVTRMSTRVIEIELLSEEHRRKKVFILRITLTPAES